jgi:hypothetical protein
MAKKNAPAEKPRFSGNYALDSLTIRNAAKTMAGEKGDVVVVATTTVLVIAVVVLLITQPANYLVITSILFIVAIVVVLVFNNRERTMARRLAKSGVPIPKPGEQQESLKRHFDVFDDRIVIKGPGDATDTYQVSDISKFWCDEETIVLRFGDGRYVIIPLKSMSNNRYLNLIDFFDKHTK